MDEEELLRRLEAKLAEVSRIIYENEQRIEALKDKIAEAEAEALVEEIYNYLED